MRIAFDTEALLAFYLGEKGGRTVKGGGDGAFVADRFVTVERRGGRGAVQFIVRHNQVV